MKRILFSIITILLVLPLQAFAVNATTTNEETINNEQTTSENTAIDDTTIENITTENTVPKQQLQARSNLKALVPGAAVTVNTVQDLIDTVNNAEMDKVITLGASFPTTLPSVINLSITHNYNITINGNGVELKPAANQKHFNVTSTGSGTVTFQSINFKGLTSLDVSGLPTPANGGGGLLLTNNQAGSFKVIDSTFSLIYGGGINLNGTGRLSVDKSTFDSNIVIDGGGAIRAENGPKLFEVTNSTFTNNVNAGAGYDGGALFIKTPSGAVNLSNSVFINNTNLRNRGGAVGINFPTATSVSKVTDCYFEGNQALSPTTNVSADGGAISLFDLATGGTFIVAGTTFFNNKADDDGGAMLLQSKENSTIIIINSTFYENSAYGKGNDAGVSGGAIQTFNNGAAMSTANYQFFSNTFVNNNSYANVSSQTQTGGAIAGSGAVFRTSKGTFQNNITINNKVYLFGGAVNTASKYQNVYMASVSNLGGNIGFDNGATITATYEDVFGIYNVQPCLNASNIKAGNPSSSSYRVIPTMPIIPNNGTVGIANKGGTVSSNLVDERDFARSVNLPDSGAVEIGWIQYNSNGGDWSLPQLTAYTGAEYYVGTNPIDYYDVGLYNADATIIDDTNLTNGTMVFVEWNTAADGSGTTYIPGDDSTTGDGLVLYAIWAAPYTVTYDGNTNTTGTAPVDSTIYLDGDDATVLGEDTLAKDGFTFIGWNTEADGSGTSYAVGDTIPMTEDITLYAQWEINVDPIDPTTDNNTTTNNTTPSLPITGQSYLELGLLGVGILAVSTLVLRKRKNK